MNNKKITVTKPFLPPLEEFIPYLQKIWENKWLTNNGEMHRQLEKELAEFLGVKYISLFSNGTLALIASLHALNLTGEVITSPFSFIATSHAIWWNKLTPVFVDVEAEFMTMNPAKIEAAITSRTSAILPIHVYGNVCNVDEIQKIADKYNLKVIYDAAHAFGVKKDELSLLNYGDLSILSFHATKVFSTIEGGAVICHSAEMKQRLDNIKNFGIISETEVTEPGVNAKLNELQAAFGLLQLKYVNQSIDKRKELVLLYRSLLDSILGVKFLDEGKNITSNYSYFPILIDEKKYGTSRDSLYEKLKTYDIFSRRYFYPLITDFEPYNKLPGSNKNNLPVATRIAKQILCLPLYDDLTESDIIKICTLIKK